MTTGTQVPATSPARYATAMWALFSDTVPSIDARKLENGEATAKAIRRALDETLGAATPEDTVIVSFSGHGSRDNRLVAYDGGRRPGNGETASRGRQDGVEQTPVLLRVPLEVTEDVSTVAQQ